MTSFTAFGKVFILVVIAKEQFLPASGHGRVLEPPNRGSLFRLEEFKHLNPPANYNDNELFCGNRTTQYELNGGKCGICGDPYNEPQPRANEDGGEFGRGIIVRGYKSGEVMPVFVQLTSNHKGYFQFRLCAKDDVSDHLDESCYQEHVLELADGSGTKYNVTSDASQYDASYSLVLPKEVTCKHCVLQWEYTAGNDWQYCGDDNSTGALGCGNQETFRGCSDIAIHPQSEESIERNPNSKYEDVTPESEPEGLPHLLDIIRGNHLK